MSGFCVIHCTEQPVSQQLEKLTSSTKLNTLKDRITYFLAHDVSPFSELSFANKHLLDCEDVATTSVYYHNQCYVKFTHRRYLKDLKRPASQSVEELHQESTAQTQSEVSSKISLNYYPISIHSREEREREGGREREREEREERERVIEPTCIHCTSIITISLRCSLFISAGSLIIYYYSCLSSSLPLMPTKIMTDSMRFCFFLNPCLTFRITFFKSVWPFVCIADSSQPQLL